MSDTPRLNAVAACSACADNHRKELQEAERGACLNLETAQYNMDMLEAAIELLVDSGTCKDSDYAEDAILQRMCEMKAAGRELAHA